MHDPNAKHAAVGTSGRGLLPPSEETPDRRRGPGAALHEQQGGARHGVTVWRVQLSSTEYFRFETTKLR